MSDLNDDRLMPSSSLRAFDGFVIIGIDEFALMDFKIFFPLSENPSTRAYRE